MSNSTTQLAVYRGYSDALHVAIDTGNIAEAVEVISGATAAFHARQLSVEQYGDLRADFSNNYPDINL